MGIHKVADKALGIILKASLPSLIVLSGAWLPLVNFGMQTATMILKGHPN